MSSYHYSDIGARKCVLTGQLANARICEFFQCYLHKHDFSGRCKKQCANRIRVKRCFIDLKIKRFMLSFSQHYYRQCNNNFIDFEFIDFFPLFAANNTLACEFLYQSCNISF